MPEAIRVRHCVTAVYVADGVNEQLERVTARDHLFHELSSSWAETRVVMDTVQILTDGDNVLGDLIKENFPDASHTLDVFHAPTSVLMT